MAAWRMLWHATTSSPQLLDVVVYLLQAWRHATCLIVAFMIYKSIPFMALEESEVAAQIKDGIRDGQPGHDPAQFCLEREQNRTIFSELALFDCLTFLTNDTVDLVEVASAMGVALKGQRVVRCNHDVLLGIVACQYVVFRVARVEAVKLIVVPRLRVSVASCPSLQLTARLDTNFPVVYQTKLTRRGSRVRLCEWLAEIRPHIITSGDNTDVFCCLSGLL